MLCEGPTEVEFVRRILRPHLSRNGTFVKPGIPLNRQNFGVVGHDKLYMAWKGAVGSARPHQFVTTMIDLYALPEDYPGRVLFPDDARARARGVESRMREAMPSRQWLPYVQLHEFEALIYTDLEALVPQFPGADLTVGLRDLRSEIGDLKPEEIGEGPQTAPSKRLLRHVPTYAKAQAGPAALETIGLPALRAACPHFDAWITTLESLTS